MENSTKALLIAAAILIAILLISIGVRILNSTQDSVDSAQDVGNAMQAKAIQIKVKTILEKINYVDDNIFGNYIRANYEGTQTPEKTAELILLVYTRSQNLFGTVRKDDEIRISRGNETDPASKYFSYNEKTGVVTMKQPNSMYNVSIPPDEKFSIFIKLAD